MSALVKKSIELIIIFVGLDEPIDEQRAADLRW
jgi:hypothetical protein